MQFFRRLGTALDDGWRSVGRDEERFPDIAAAALEDLPPGDHLEREALLDALLDPAAPAVRQLAPVGVFGQPGITVFHGDGFVVDLYFWLNSESAVHNHPFCGVFTVLEGFSVHARYDVALGERVGSLAHLADVTLADLELIRPGHVERFSLRRHPLIHALIHVPVPSISMVARTVRTEGYVRYLPPSLALAVDQPGEPAARRLALLSALGAADDARYAERLARELRGADFEGGVRLLAEGWAGWAPDTRSALLDLLRARHGDAVDAIPPALDAAARLGEATALREQLRDPDLRLVSIALGYADSRARLLELLGDDALALLHRFVDEAPLFEPDEEATATIAHALVDGGGREGALRRLVEEYGAEELRPHEAAVADYCESSLFAVLAR